MMALGAAISLDTVFLRAWSLRHVAEITLLGERNKVILRQALP